MNREERGGNQLPEIPAPLVAYLATTLYLKGNKGERLWLRRMFKDSWHSIQPSD